MWIGLAVANRGARIVYLYNRHALPACDARSRQRERWARVGIGSTRRWGRRAHRFAVTAGAPSEWPLKSDGAPSEWPLKNDGAPSEWPFEE